MLRTLSEIMDEEWNNIKIIFAEPWEIPWVVPAGERDDYEIHFLEKGSGRFCVGKTEHHISRGDIVLLHSKEGNSFVSEEVPFRFMYITFKINHFKNSEKIDEFNRLLCCGNNLIKLTNPQKVQEFFYQIYREFCLKSDGYMFRIKLLLGKLILTLMDQCDYADSNNSRKLNLNKNSHELVNRVIIFLQTNCNREITLEELGKLFNLHPRYLCTLFRQVSGKTVVELLHEIRIEKAKRLLLYTSLSITQIALEVGFGNSQYFSRIFRQLENTDPRTFRKTNKR